ncbi:MAG: DASH family cryptochrome [Cyanobacteria bacterium P01_H01_bin.15]
MISPQILVWFRNDLRVHDHEPLWQAAKAGGGVIPVYCFDPRQFSETRFGFPKTGPIRAQFLRESVEALREILRKLGSDLIIRHGTPETVLPKLAEEFKATALYYHAEVTAEELAVEQAVESALAKQTDAIYPPLEINRFWGATLYHLNNLPFEISKIPELFTSFRKKLEKSATVEPAYGMPAKLPPIKVSDRGELPENFEKVTVCDRVVLPFRGGETAGQARLKDYFWKTSALRRYKETRNGMLGANYSSKFSPWLALGCLSPRYIYEQVQAYEEQRVRNDSTYWLVFELLWRDFFRFMALKHGNVLFKPVGIQGVSIPWKEDWERFDCWQQGKTGYPLVDANMRELLATGFMSNRGRQNVASFLTKNLGIDWRIGAEWFESQLIDYDVCSNYGNWNYTAGVGNDARGFRYFNIPKQSRQYDPAGDYLRHWLPELANVAGDKIHEPWKLSQTEQKQWGVRLGVDYPRPVVDFFKSVKANENVYLAAVGS